MMELLESINDDVPHWLLFMRKLRSVRTYVKSGAGEAAKPVLSVEAFQKDLVGLSGSMCTMCC